MTHLVWGWWGQLWPNLAASGLTFTSGLVWARRRLLAEWERREAEHLTRHQETHRLIRELSARVAGQARQVEQRNQCDDDLRS